jgi:energy-coupling factor transport system ATP-binding protein
MRGPPERRPSLSAPRYQGNHHTVISFANVSFSYRASGTPLVALSDVSIDIRPGEMVAIVGANGSGKSTLARLTNGLLLPDAGTVEVDGADTSDESRTREIREHVAIVLQHPDDQIVATAVEDDVAFGPENLGLDRVEIRRRVDCALAAVGLTGLERREPHLLSGGQKQRLAIAGALAMEPDYLVLDEPTSMLDPEGRRDVASVIEQLGGSGKGILLITHDLAEAARADRVVVLDRGAVVYSGTASQLVERDELLIECGLETPPLVLLAAQLRNLGVETGSGLLEPGALADALCR